MIEEKWQWITDLTDGSSRAEGDTSDFQFGNDQFDDAEFERHQADFIMSGADFPREEERIGRVLGLVAAGLFWAIVSGIYIYSTWGRQ